MNKLHNVLFFVFVAVLIFSFIANQSISQVNDYDGNTYKTVKIGTQTWMAENLNVEHYRNGDPIPQVTDADEWLKLTTGAWCYNGNKTSNGKIYSKLYNWYAINDSRGLAPKGWHVPSDEEWIQLSDYLGGDRVAGKKMKSTNGWIENGNGTNESGFNGLPGSFRADDGSFGAICYSGYWWTTTENKFSFVLFNFLYSGDALEIFSASKKSGCSVRCIKD